MQQISDIDILFPKREFLALIGQNSIVAEKKSVKFKTGTDRDKKTQKCSQKPISKCISLSES